MGDCAFVCPNDAPCLINEPCVVNDPCLVMEQESNDPGRTVVVFLLILSGKRTLSSKRPLESIAAPM